MKNISKLVLGVCCTATLSLNSCIEETFPTNGATTDQLGSSAKATEALLWAMPAFANDVETVVGNHWEWGYGSLIHIRDVMTGDLAIPSSPYSIWYHFWYNNSGIGPNTSASQFIWNYYWKFVQTTNNLISAVNPETATEMQLGYLGAGYGFRAMLYLDMAQSFEFLENDAVSSINSSGNDVKGLTVPIVTETTSEETARNNPRATREQMAEFILSDLNKAEEYIVHLDIATKTLPHLDAIYGLKARYYMWLGEYASARDYARRAINETSSDPMTESEWLDPTTGFNQLDYWMWGSQLQAEDAAVQTGLLNWTSFMSVEALYGYAWANGGGMMNMIDAHLYSQIADTDFRKKAWKAPQGSALEGQTVFIIPEQAALVPDYASVKFRPAQGNTSDYTVASASAYPFMRVEEMYFIEAEAAAHLNASEGKTLLENFMKSYRDPSYVCNNSDVVFEVLLQKRIELWGEGTTFYDIKRLDLSVTRGYPGTNWTDAARFNTDGRPAWMNFSIVTTEENNNEALRGWENPDPSGCYDTWLE